MAFVATGTHVFILIISAGGLRKQQPVASWRAHYLWVGVR